MSVRVNLANAVCFPIQVCDVLDQTDTELVAGNTDGFLQNNVRNVHARLRVRLGRPLCGELRTLLESHDMELAAMHSDDDVAQASNVTAETIDALFSAYFGSGDDKWIGWIVAAMERTSCVSAFLAAAWSLHTFGQCGLIDLTELRTCTNARWIAHSECTAMMLS